jgi:ElaB/YqjD/DUF883 family membrane-anchored ribosome-binding protein
MDRVGAGARRMTSATSSFVSTNAIPLTLLAVGAGWLYYATRNQNARAVHRVRPHDYAADSRRAGLYGAGIDEGDGQSFLLHEHDDPRFGGRARDEGAHLYDRAQEGAQRMGQRAADLGHRISDRTMDFGHRVSDRTMELGRRTSEQLGRAQDRTTDFARDNPLALGALAIAAGVGIGLALPTSRVENDLLGPTRDRLADQASSTAREAKRLMSETAHQVAHAAHGAVDDLTHASAAPRTS